MYKKLSTTLLSIVLLCSCLGNAQSITSKENSARNFVNIVHIINKDGSSGISGYGSVLPETLVSEISFLTDNNLKATFFMQYDALTDKGYTEPVSTATTKGSEAGGFWHPTQALVKKSGISWKGEAIGDMLDGNGFHSSYSKAEKEKIAMAYMEEFKNTFGYYPKSIGSHYVDSQIISFMKDKYAIEAWFVCETEKSNNSILNDGFEGVYYPNKYNASIPAQNTHAQIDIPIIRVARDDSRYLNTIGIATGSDTLTEEYIDVAFERHSNLVSDYNITYYGGYMLSAPKDYNTTTENRAAMFQSLEDNKDVRIATVAETSKWFKDTFKTTPAYSYGTYANINGLDRPVIRYNSRFYSVNLVWDEGTAIFRDLYKFDEKQTEANSGKITDEARSCYGLPLSDGKDWGSNTQKSGLFLMEQIPGVGLTPIGCRDPREISHNADSVSVVWKDRYDERTFTLTFNEKTVKTSAQDNHSGKNSIDWMMALLTAKEKGKLLPFTIIVPQKISANICNFVYHIDITTGKVALNSDDTPVSIKLFPDNGTFELDLSI